MMMMMKVALAAALVGSAAAQNARPTAGTISCGETRFGSTVNGAHTLGMSSREQHYEFTLTETTSVAFNGCNASYDIYLRIYNQAMNQQIAYRDDGGCPAGISRLRTVLTRTLEAGTYNVIVEGFSNRQGSYSLSMGCSEPTTTPAPGPAMQEEPLQCGGYAVGDTRTGTHRFGHRAREHHYRLTLPTRSLVTLNACNANYDVYLRIYNEQMTTQIAYRDDGGCPRGVHPYRVSMDRELDAGTYTVVVDGFSMNEGRYNLTVGCQTVTTTERPASSCPAHTHSSNGECVPNSVCNVGRGHTNDVSECFRLRSYFNAQVEVSYTGSGSLTSADYFREVRAINGSDSADLVSIESCGMPGHYLTRTRLGLNRRALPTVLLLPLDNHASSHFADRATWLHGYSVPSSLMNSNYLQRTAQLGSATPQTYADPENPGQMLRLSGDGELRMYYTRNWYWAMWTVLAKVSQKPRVATTDYETLNGCCRGPGYMRPRSRYIGFTHSLAEAHAACNAIPGCTAVERRYCRSNPYGTDAQRSMCQTQLYFHHDVVAGCTTNSRFQCHARRIEEVALATSDGTAASLPTCPTVANVQSEADCQVQCAMPRAMGCPGAFSIPTDLVVSARRNNIVYVPSNGSSTCSATRLDTLPHCYERCVSQCVADVRDRPARAYAPAAVGAAIVPARQNGFCVDSSNRDVNRGTQNLGVNMFRHPNVWLGETDCLTWCTNYTGATGCERIVNQWNRGCYVFTTPAVHHGNGYRNHYCWILNVVGLTAPEINSQGWNRVSSYINRGCFSIDNLRWGSGASEQGVRRYITALYLQNPGFKVAANAMMNDHSDATFRVRRSLLHQMGASTGETVEAVASIESCDVPGNFITVDSRGRVKTQAYQRGSYFATAASFIIREGEFYQGSGTLEPLNRRGYRLRGSFTRMFINRATDSFWARRKEMSWIAREPESEDSFNETLAGQSVSTDVCEGQTGSITCPGLTVIEVVDAFYGRRDNTTCFPRRCDFATQFNATTGEQTCRIMQTWLNTARFPAPTFCSAPAASYVESQCNGRKSCSLRPTNRIFGDPCWYTYKYMNVQHRCVLPEGIRATLVSEEVANLGLTGAQYISTNATATSDRTCTACSSCLAPEFIVADCTEFSDTVCGNSSTGYVPRDGSRGAINYTICVDGEEFESVAASPTSDRSCSACTECAPGTYISTNCSGSTDRVCTAVAPGYYTNTVNALFPLPVTTCPAGTAAFISPTATSDRFCTACVQGSTFSTEANVRNCRRVRNVCDGVNMFETASPTTTSDRVCTNTTTCSVDQYMTQDATASTDRQCAPLTQCDVSSQFISTASTPTSNRVCTNARTCTNSEFMVSAHHQRGDTVCQALRLCNASEWEFAVPTATSDRVCHAHSVCHGGQFEVTAGTATSDRVCEATVDCDADQWETAAPTATSNRRCADLTVCSASEYQSQAHTASTDRQCSPISVCTAGYQYEVTAPTSTSNRVCAVVTECSSSEWENAAPTTTSDRDCQPVTSCTSSQYETQAPTESSNRICADLSAPCDSSQWESRPAAWNMDRICSTPRVCTADEWMSDDYTPSADRVCNQLSTCGAEEFISTPHTSSSDRVCTAARICSSSEFETQSVTPTSDRVCQELSVCNASSQYEGTAASDTSDRICLPLRECDNMTEWESTAPTSVSNRVCSNITTCDTSFEFESTPATEVSDAVCNVTVQCAPDEYESIAPTYTSDRSCEPLAQCTDDEFESIAATPTTNKECSPLTVCPSGSVVSVEATKVSDRQCVEADVGKSEASSGDALSTTGSTTTLVGLVAGLLLVALVALLAVTRNKNKAPVYAVPMAQQLAASDHTYEQPGHGAPASDPYYGTPMGGESTYEVAYDAPVRIPEGAGKGAMAEYVAGRRASARRRTSAALETGYNMAHGSGAASMDHYDLGASDPVYGANQANYEGASSAAATGNAYQMGTANENAYDLGQSAEYDVRQGGTQAYNVIGNIAHDEYDLGANNEGTYGIGSDYAAGTASEDPYDNSAALDHRSGSYGDALDREEPSRYGRGADLDAGYGASASENIYGLE